MNRRLALLMFMQLFGLGAFFPILSHYLLNVLHLDGTQTGWIFSASSLASVISPLACAVLADRLISSQRLFALCHVLAGIAVWALAYQTEFGPFFVLYCVYTVLYGPTMALAQAIVFHHLRGGRESFARVRVWGTIGWIVVALLFGYGWLRGGGGLAEERLGDAFILAGACSFFLALYGLLLPRIDLHRSGAVTLLPRGSLQVICGRGVRVVLALGFAAAFLDRYFYFGAAPYLKSMGVPEASILPAMSIAQVPEVLSMALLGWMLASYGVRAAILCGLFMQVARFSIFVLSSNLAFTLVGVACHGFGYGLFFTTAYIYLDRRCEASMRAGAHLIFAVLVGAAATFLGSLTAGALLDFYRADYRLFWTVPAVVSGLTLIAALHWLPREGAETRGGAASAGA